MEIRRARATLQSLRREIVRDVKGAIGKTMTQGLTEARRMSSGPFSLAQLRKMGHPYAKRHKRPALFSIASNAAMINDHGGFKQAWEKDPPQPGDSMISGRLSNQSEAAHWLARTTASDYRGTMVPRPIEGYLRGFVHKTAIAEIHQALRRLQRYHT